MVEQYTGKDRRYAGDDVDITYSLKRCIHAEFCVKRLSAVFDKNARPWINANGASPDEMTSVVELCPSGALHYDRKDGVQEAIPEKNVIKIRHNGPLEVRGDLAIEGATVALAQETRASLCRCGASNNKPFCDNTHKEIQFEAVEAVPTDGVPAPSESGKLVITACENGPLELNGPVEIINEAGDLLFQGNGTALCRCGGSGNKPFCDGTHERIHFTAE